MNSYTRHVLDQIPLEIRAEFSDRQITALDDVLGSSSFAGRRLVDIKAVLPLYFIRLFVDLFIGMDRRAGQQKKVFSSRQKIISGVTILFLLFIILTTLGVFFLATLYLIKVVLGIDLFAGFHLLGFLGLH